MDEEILKEKSDRHSELDLLRQAAEAVVAKNVLGHEEKVSGFLAMVGEQYSSELTVVGRAPNGWPCGQQLSSEVIKVFVENALTNAVQHSPSGKTYPMRWVTDLWGAERASSYGED